MKVYMLLDRSGSMASRWQQAIGSINEYVSGLPKDSSVYLATFDTNYNNDLGYDVIRETMAGDWRKINAEEVYPRGGTPLNDAAGKLLNKLFLDDPRKAIVVVMTDGEENSSREYTTAAIKAKFDMAKERGYEVVFLGADFKEVEKQAWNYGIASNRVMNTTAQNMGSTMRGFAVSSASYSMQDAQGGAATMDCYFSEENKLAAETTGIDLTKTATPGKVDVTKVGGTTE